MVDSSVEPMEPSSPTPILPAVPPAAPAPRPAGWRQSLWELFKTAVIVLVFVTAVRSFVVEAYVIHGKSMEPTFHDSERLLISKFAPRFDSLHRGDIVIFNHPTEPGKRLIKRVVGLPGETVRFEHGHVYINDEPLEEPYGSLDGYEMLSVGVKPDHYFLLGDNREISNDSRRMGLIPRDAIVGKALVKFFPNFKLY